MGTLEQNLLVNKILKQKYDILGIKCCEIGRAFGYIPLFKQCVGSRQGYAHDKERRHYKLNPEEMSMVRHTLSACNYCHDVIDAHRELRILIFSKLRPASFIEPMVKITPKQKAKLTSKKPLWYFSHKCKSCGRISKMGVNCSLCGEISI